MNGEKKLQIVGISEIDEISPEQIVFPEGLITTHKIGNLDFDGNVGTLVKPGGSLQDFFKVFYNETIPTIKKPSLSWYTYGGSGFEEPGTIIPKYSNHERFGHKVTFNPGSYEFGPDTGITVTKWEYSLSRSDGTIIMQHVNENNPGPIDEYRYPAIQVIDDSGGYRSAVTVTYTEGTIPKTNIGNAYRDGIIPAGSITKAGYFLRGRRMIFYGSTTNKDELTSDIIRNLHGGYMFQGWATGYKDESFKFDVDARVGAMRVVIAFPETEYELVYIKDESNMTVDITSSFRVETIDVEGANGYAAIPYKVYVLDYAQPIDVKIVYEVSMIT